MSVVEHVLSDVLRPVEDGLNDDHAIICDGVEEHVLDMGVLAQSSPKLVCGSSHKGKVRNQPECTMEALVIRFCLCVTERLGGVDVDLFERPFSGLR